MDFQHKRLTLCSASLEGNIIELLIFIELEHSNLSTVAGFQTLHRVCPEFKPQPP